MKIKVTMTNKQAIIGITSYARDESDHFRLPATYIEAVRRAGGIPLLLPPGEPYYAQLLDLLDGVILSGGGDIEPALYGGQKHETIYMINSERDSSEIDLARKVVDLRLPILNICRGAQVLNVALGGTLIEDLPAEVGQDILHRMRPNGPTPHSVTVKPESRLAQIMGQSEVTTASWHHQAVRQLAPGLEVVAQASDGTIEAFEMPGHPWLIAVQWHPELTAPDDPSQQRLFDVLVEMAIKKRR